MLFFIIHRKNGAPKNDVTIPTGSSLGAIITLENVSAKVKNVPPKKIETGIRVKCLELVNFLDIWGIISPINPMTPLTETNIPVSRVEVRIIIILILCVLTPKILELSSPKSKISSSLWKNIVIPNTMRIKLPKR